MTAEHHRFSREGILAFASDFPFFNLIGLEVLDVGPGWSKTRLEHRADLTQPAGILHGGVIASLVDTGIAHALFLTERFQELREEGRAVVSVDLRIKYFRPVSEAEVVCESKVTRFGRQIIHAESIVTNAQGKEVARGDATYMTIAPSRLERS